MIRRIATLPKEILRVALAMSPGETKEFSTPNGTVVATIRKLSPDDIQAFDVVDFDWKND